MKLIRLTLKNFMPYKGETVLEFPEDPNRNTLVVLGDNMRGKTSLLNGIRWAFYEKAQGRHLRPIPLHLMLNREAAAEGDWTMEARIEFEAGGSLYDLRREAKKKSTVLQPSRPEDFQVFAHLQKDGSAIPGDSIETEINKFAPEQVSRFFLFDGELLQEYEELLIEGSEQGKKIKEAIEQALGVPALINGRDDLQTLRKQAQKEQAKEAQSIKGMESTADLFSKWAGKRDVFENDLAILKEKHASLKDERQALEDEISASQSLLEQKGELDAKTARRNEIAKELKDKGELKLELVSGAWRDMLRPKILVKKANLLKLQEEATRHIKQRAKLQFSIEHLQEHMSASICPTCHQKIENKDRENQQRQLDDYLSQREKLGVLSIDIEDVNRNLKALDIVLGTSIKDRLLDVDDDLMRLELDSAKIDTRIDQLQAELDEKGADEIVRKRGRLQQALRDETKCVLEIEDTEKSLAAADRELQALSQRISAQAGKNTTKASQIAKILEQMHSVFAASVDNLRASLRTTVEKNASDAFLSMSTQKAYLGLSINDNYGLSIIGKDGENVPLRSAGAEQIVALSLIDGLSRAGRAAGPVVMDTPFGRLDTKHRQNILRYLPDSASQLVLFVHDGEIAGGVGLDALTHRIGARYEIREISQSHSVLERLS
jgi:DNA sulfur modification protein DndD